MKDSPCKNCDIRTVNCHSKCKKYIAWKKLINAISKKLREKQTADRIYEEDKFRKKRIRK